MAEYPGYDSWRLPWDIDGTRLFSIDAGIATELFDEKVTLNSEDDTVTVDRALTYAWVFPSRRSLARMMVYTDGGGGFTVEFSDNSTDGVDGTWTTPEELVTAIGTDPALAYRTGIRRTTQDCKAVRISSIGATNSGSELAMVHLFGDFDYSVDVESLVLWHPKNDTRLNPEYFDFGTVIRGSSEDLPFRVKNLSSTLTAIDVSVFLDALTSPDPAIDVQHLLSEEGFIFRSRESLGDLAPTTVSGSVTLRRNTSRVSELGGPFAFRVRAVASNWESAIL